MVDENKRLAELLVQARAAALHFLNQLNLIGSAVLAYVLAYPDAFAELRDILPEPIRPFAPALAIAWFLLVQFAKARAVAAKKAPSDAG